MLNVCWESVKPFNDGYHETNKLVSIIGGFLLLPIKELKKSDLKGLKFSICYWRISVTLGSGLAGFNCNSWVTDY